VRPAGANPRRTGPRWRTGGSAKRRGLHGCSIPLPISSGGGAWRRVPRRRRTGRASLGGGVPVSKEGRLGLWWLKVRQGTADLHLQARVRQYPGRAPSSRSFGHGEGKKISWRRPWAGEPPCGVALWDATLHAGGRCGCGEETGRGGRE
jgi:hypothetical protein